MQAEGKVMTSAPALTRAIKDTNPMTQTDSVCIARPRRFTPKIVGGIDHLPDDRAQKQPTDAHDAHQPLTGSLSTTCKNSRFRQARDEAWNRARHTTSYWRARLDWHSDLEFAQKRGLADSGSFPPAADENRFSLADTWREAVVKQLLTPAPNVAAVAWKRARLSGRDFHCLPVKP